APDLIAVQWVTGIAYDGDSGGPLFCGDKLVGTVAGHADGEYPDHREELYTRVDRALPWINDEIQKWAIVSADAGDTDAGDADGGGVDAGGGDGSLTTPVAASPGTTTTTSGCSIAQTGRFSWLPLVALAIAFLAIRRRSTSR